MSSFWKTLSSDNEVKEWKNEKGELHREDGPAVIVSCPGEYDREEYWVGGKLHREDGPAIIYRNGDYEYYLNGKPHREDGPAKFFEYDREEYWVGGKLHREDGPAVYHYEMEPEYWINGNILSFNEYKKWFIKKISSPTYKLTDGDVEFIKQYLE